MILHEISFTLISLKKKSYYQYIYAINIIFSSSLELFLKIITIIVDSSIFGYKRKESISKWKIEKK